MHSPLRQSLQRATSFATTVHTKTIAANQLKAETDRCATSIKIYLTTNKIPKKHGKEFHFIQGSRLLPPQQRTSSGQMPEVQQRKLYVEREKRRMYLVRLQRQ